jgi:hypothetical protein
MVTAPVDNSISAGESDLPKQKDGSHNSDGVGRSIGIANMIRKDVSMSRRSLEVFRDESYGRSTRIQ